MANGRLKSQRSLIVAQAQISSPPEGSDIDVERFIETGDLGGAAPVILKYDPKVLESMADSGKFGA